MGGGYCSVGSNVRQGRAFGAGADRAGQSNVGRAGRCGQLKIGCGRSITPGQGSMGKADRAGQDRLNRTEHCRRVTLAACSARRKPQHCFGPESLQR